MIRTTLLLCLLLAGCQTFEPDNIMGVVTISDYYPTNKKEFGTGYNTVTLRRTYTNPVTVNTEHFLGDGYISCEFEIKLCKSREEFFSSMSGGVSTSGSYMGVEGSASVKFLTETTITSLDSVLIASVEAVTNTEYAPATGYVPDAQKLLDEELYERFIETYGTHYQRNIISGGKMMLIMKFTSNSRENKSELDSKLGLSTGVFGAEAEFAAAMKSVKESSSMSVKSWASGSNIEPPQPNVEACIQYAIDFAKSVLEYPAVKKLQYTALWTIPETPAAFKQFIFRRQSDTDKVVRISVALLNVDNRCTDMKALKKAEMSFITESAWEDVETIHRETTAARTSVQNLFKTIKPTEFAEQIIARYQATAERLDARIDEILDSERRLDSTKSMFIKSAGTGKFISTADGGYPRLDSRSPIAINMRGTIANEGLNIVIGGNYFTTIRRDSDKRYSLCMGSNLWYCFWERDQDSNPRCQWRLAHASDVSKSTLDYGDRLIVYNRYWPSYIMGVSDDGQWLGTIDAKHYGNKNHQWQVDKSNRI